MCDISDWALRHSITEHALSDLQRVLEPVTPVDRNATGSEASGQQKIRLQAGYNNTLLMRNNNGAVTTEDGRHIRFGLMNDTPAMNKKSKSSDLIGITTIEITHEHVGTKMGVFTAIECKKPGWVFKGTPRENAQLSFHNLVKLKGGIAQFATGPEDIWG